MLKQEKEEAIDEIFQSQNFTSDLTNEKNTSMNNIEGVLH